MKRIIRMEEVVDFFCGKRIEKLTYGEIRTAVGKMIMKQNRQRQRIIWRWGSRNMIY